MIIKKVQTRKGFYDYYSYKGRFLESNALIKGSLKLSKKDLFHQRDLMLHKRDCTVKENRAVKRNRFFGV